MDSGGTHIMGLWKTGLPVIQFSISLLCPSGISKCMYSSQVKSSFHSPSVRHTGFQLVRGFVLPVRPLGRCIQYVTQTTDSPVRVSIHVISLFLWIPSQGHRSWPDHFSYLLYHPDLPSILLLSWRGFSESFILKFDWPYRQFF